MTDVKMTAKQLEGILEWNEPVEEFNRAIDSLLAEFRESGALTGRIVLDVTNDLDPEGEEDEDEEDNESEDEEEKKA